MNNVFTALYCDGATLASHAATVEFPNDGTLRLSTGELTEAHPLAALQISAQLARVPRFLRLPTGATLELPESDELSAALDLVQPHTRLAAILHTLETHSAVAVTATILLAITATALIWFGTPALARHVAFAVPQPLEERIGATSYLVLTAKLGPSQLSKAQRSAAGQAYLRVLAAGHYRVNPSGTYPPPIKPTMGQLEQRMELAGLLPAQNFKSNTVLQLNIGGTFGALSILKNAATSSSATDPRHLAPSLQFESMNVANAFALPGGPIVVSDQLVRLVLENLHGSDMLAAVYAHELAHIERRHGLQLILRNSGALLAVATITGDLSTLTTFSGTLPFLLIQRGYSREFESEADADAVRLLRDANIDPSALADVLELLEKQRPAKGPDFTYLSTHPATPERIRALRNERTPPPR